MRAVMVWALCTCCGTSCTLGFCIVTTRDAHGDGAMVCRELGMPVNPWVRLTRLKDLNLQTMKWVAAATTLHPFPALTFPTWHQPQFCRHEATDASLRAVRSRRKTSPIRAGR